MGVWEKGEYNLQKSFYSSFYNLFCTYKNALVQLDPPPSFTSTRFDDGILPTPHFSTRLPSLSPLRRSGSFSMRSGPPQQASSTPVARSSPSTLGAHPLSFSSLPSPQFSPSSPHTCPVLASLPTKFLPPHPYHPCLRFLRHFTLFFFTFVKSHNVLCLVLS